MSHAPREVRILVIEDDPATLGLLREIFADGDIAMVGADHEKLPEPAAFLVVVTDLPRRNTAYTSDEARRWVRYLSDRYAAPIIVLTGHADAWKDHQLRAIADVMTKPADVDELVRRVRAAAASD